MQLPDSPTLSPCLCSLPMGWKWSVAIAQHIHEKILNRVLPDSEVIVDGEPTLPFAGEGAKEVKAFGYIDDGAVLSQEESLANRGHQQLEEAWTEEGFKLHAQKGHLAQTASEPLGARLDGRRGRLSGKPKRTARLRAATDALLRRDRASGLQSHEVQAIIGHYTYLFLV